MTLCIDTCIFIDFFRGKPEAQHFLKKISTQKNLVIFSAITETELLSGKSCHDFKNRQLVLSVLSNFEKIEVDNPVAQVAGYVRRTFSVSIPDAIIAATAIKTDAVLYTKNKKDFDLIHHLLNREPY